MRDVRPGREHRLDEGGRRLLYDLRHKTSVQVALEHKARHEKAAESAKATTKSNLFEIAKDGVLRGDPIDWNGAAYEDKRSIWPHTDDIEKYCTFCKMHGCQAPKPAQEQ